MEVFGSTIAEMLGLRECNGDIYQELRFLKYSNISELENSIPVLYQANPELIKKYILPNIENLRQEWLKQASEVFFNMPAEINKNRADFKISIKRPVLRDQYNFESRNVAEYFANIRLSYRDQKRLSRQIEEDSSPLFEKRILQRGWTYNQPKYLGLETQALTKNGAKTDLVINLGKYKKISNDITEKIILLNVELSNKNAENIKDSHIASWIIQIIQHKKIENFLYKKDGEIIPFSRPTKKHLFKLLVDITYLILGCEVIRNPASLVTNVLILQKIADGTLTWKTALNRDDYQDKYGGGDMPMSMGEYNGTDKKKKQAEPVKAARALQDRYGIFSHTYRYPGESLDYSKRTDKLKINELLRREHAIIASALPTEGSDEEKIQQFEAKIRKIFGYQ